MALFIIAMSPRATNEVTNPTVLVSSSVIPSGQHEMIVLHGGNVVELSVVDQAFSLLCRASSQNNTSAIWMVSIDRKWTALKRQASTRGDGV